MIAFLAAGSVSFRPTPVPWRAGIHKRESRTGRSGHEHFPGLILPKLERATPRAGPMGFTMAGQAGIK